MSTGCQHRLQRGQPLHRGPDLIPVRCAVGGGAVDQLGPQRQRACDPFLHGGDKCVARNQQPVCGPPQSNTTRRLQKGPALPDPEAHPEAERVGGNQKV